MTQILARTCTIYLRHLGRKVKHADPRTAQAVYKHSLKGFGTGPKSSDGDGGGPDGVPPGPIISRFPSGASLFGRRRPLSPLERVSRLLPQDSLSKEVWELRENTSLKEEEEPEQAQEGATGDVHQLDIQRDASRDAQGQDGAVKPELQKQRAAEMERMMCFGEVLLAEYCRNRRLEFRKMFQLKEGMKLQSSWGAIPHQAIEGRPPGTVLRTSIGLPMLFRRPSLEEFTLFMKRGPAIAYPKDVSAMLMMMDVNEGDCVLESGSGSGAMSLFLSRAVGSRGSVLSVEVREDHHKRTVLNYQRWRSTWKYRRGEEWPDNVHFHHGDLLNSAPLFAGRSFNSVALDMVSPHLALPTVVPHLHNGAICSVYMANLTQIIELLEGLRCSTLPLVCERIIEVQYRDWLLAPSLKKDGTFNQHKAISEETIGNDEEEEEKEVLSSQKQAPFCSVPYIARPHPEQFGHTAFLVKLRKILK